MDKLDNKTGDEYRHRKQVKIRLYDEGRLNLLSLDENEVNDIENVFPKKLSDVIVESIKSKSVLKNIIFGTTQKHCTTCGNLLEGKYCTECGPTQAHCSNCAAEIDFSSGFCTSCGHKK